MLNLLRGVLIALIFAGLTLANSGVVSADVEDRLLLKYDFPAERLLFIWNKTGDDFDHQIFRFTDGNGKNSLLFVCHGSVNDNEQYCAHMGGKYSTDYAWFIDNELRYHINKRDITYNFEKVYLLSCYAGYAPQQKVKMPNIKNPKNQQPMELQMVLYTKAPHWIGITTDSSGWRPNHVYLYEELQRVPKAPLPPVVGKLFRADIESDESNESADIVPDTEQINKESEDSALYYESGTRHLRANNYNEAIADFSKAIELYPEYAAAYAGRAVSYRRLKNFDQALVDYNKAIELEPNDASLFYNRGITYHYAGNYNNAIKDYDKAIELDPNYADAYCNRGIAYRNLGQYGNAIKDYNQAKELLPNDPSIYNNCGVAYRMLGNYKSALENYNDAININADYILAYKNRGALYNERGQYESALADFDKVINSEQKDASDYYNRGNSYRGLEKYKEAIKDYTEAIALKDDYQDAYLARGKAYKSLGENQKASEDFSKAESLNSR